ncbi:hypothetical protein FISHEDRAFT_78248 [Fistulina hepatica ATCC 64428]|nr:hypothetical protein FISHEDRAFT_78248 [Fistulina hepatica ATCC 64428]
MSASARRKQKFEIVLPTLDSVLIKRQQAPRLRRTPRDGFPSPVALDFTPVSTDAAARNVPSTRIPAVQEGTATGMEDLRSDFIVSHAPFNPADDSSRSSPASDSSEDVFLSFSDETSPDVSVYDHDAAPDSQGKPTSWDAPSPLSTLTTSSSSRSSSRASSPVPTKTPSSSFCVKALPTNKPSTSKISSDDATGRSDVSSFFTGKSSIKKPAPRPSSQLMPPSSASPYPLPSPVTQSPPASSYATPTVQLSDTILSSTSGPCIASTNLGLIKKRIRSEVLQPLTNPALGKKDSAEVTSPERKRARIELSKSGQDVMSDEQAHGASNLADSINSATANNVVGSSEFNTRFPKPQPGVRMQRTQSTSSNRAGVTTGRTMQELLPCKTVDKLITQQMNQYKQDIEENLMRKYEEHTKLLMSELAAQREEADRKMMLLQESILQAQDKLQATVAAQSDALPSSVQFRGSGTPASRTLVNDSDAISEGISECAGQEIIETDHLQHPRPQDRLADPKDLVDYYKSVSMRVDAVISRIERDEMHASKDGEKTTQDSKPEPDPTSPPFQPGYMHPPSGHQYYQKSSRPYHYKRRPSGVRYPYNNHARFNFTNNQAPTGANQEHQNDGTQRLPDFGSTNPCFHTFDQSHRPNNFNHYFNSSQRGGSNHNYSSRSRPYRGRAHWKRGGPWQQDQGWRSQNLHHTNAGCDQSHEPQKVLPEQDAGGAGAQAAPPREASNGNLSLGDDDDSMGPLDREKKLSNNEEAADDNVAVLSPASVSRSPQLSSLRGPTPAPEQLLANVISSGNARGRSVDSDRDRGRSSGRHRDASYDRRRSMSFSSTRSRQIEASSVVYASQRS